MSELFRVSSAPHVRAKTSTQNVMMWVIIAMIPTAVFGIWNFGFRALLLIVATVLSCVLSETVFNLIAKKKNTIGDLSAVVTGMILALNMPVTLPIWMAILGGVFAIVVVKMLFGGLGQNFMNPALAGRCFLLIAFTSEMSNFVTDAYTSATPLAELISTKGIVAPWNKYQLMDMFIGTTPGTIGETSTAALLIGLVILLAAKVITLRIPVAYLGSFAVLMFFFGERQFSIPEIMAGAVDVSTLATGAVTYTLAQLMCGGIMFGAIFMATDYVTTPLSKLGKVVFCIGCGVLTFAIRTGFLGGYPEGVSISILFMNLLTPLIEKWTNPRTLGGVR